jgi:hypothetical protein
MWKLRIYLTDFLKRVNLPKNRKKQDKYHRNQHAWCTFTLFGLSIAQRLRKLSGCQLLNGRCIGRGLGRALFRDADPRVLQAAGMPRTRIMPVDAIREDAEALHLTLGERIAARSHDLDGRALRFAGRHIRILCRTPAP